MIDIGQARDGIADVVRPVEDLKHVYPRAIDGLTAFPAVVVGQPKWQPGPTFCLDTYEFPIAVIVARPGIADDATVAQLDALWPAVLAALQSGANDGFGVGAAASIDRAEFGLFAIQGQQYPAQVINITITG